MKLSLEDYLIDKTIKKVYYDGGTTNIIFTDDTKLEIFTLGNVNVHLNVYDKDDESIYTGLI